MDETDKNKVCSRFSFYFVLVCLFICLFGVVGKVLVLFGRVGLGFFIYFSVYSFLYICFYVLL